MCEGCVKEDTPERSMCLDGGAYMANYKGMCALMKLLLIDAWSECLAPSNAGRRSVRIWTEPNLLLCRSAGCVECKSLQFPDESNKEVEEDDLTERITFQRMCTTHRVLPVCGRASWERSVVDIHERQAWQTRNTRQWRLSFFSLRRPCA